jgi:methyl-accepting chemotaxis protein
VSSVDAVAKRLDELASESSYRDLGSDLKRLADDLRTGDTTGWRGVDLVSYFDAGSVSGRARGLLAALSRHVEIVRNVLLFTPLFFTWVGIFAAVQAYRELLAAPWTEQKQFEDASFLQLWTRGFGDRTWWTLDHVAMCDFSALAAVIITFLVGSWLQNRTTAAEEEDRRAKVSALRSTLTDARLALREHGTDLVDRITTSLRSLLPEYRQTVQQLVTAQQEMSDLVTGGKDNIALMVQATGDLALSSTTIAASAKSMENPTGRLAGHVHGVETASRELATSLGQVATGVAATGDGLAEVVRGVGDLGHELRETYSNRIEDLRRESSVHAAAVSGLIDARHELSRSIEAGRAGVAQWLRGTEAIAAGGGSVANSVDGLREKVEALGAASENFDRSIGSMVNGTQSLAAQLPAAQKGVLEVLEAVTQLSKKLDGVHERQERLTANIAALADNPQAAASAAKRTAEAARAAEVALQQTVAALPGQMDQLRLAVVAAFDRELEHRRAAAESIGASVGKFNGEAGQTAQALASAVDGLRSAPTLMLPELRTASQDLVEALDKCRVLVTELVAARAKKPGRRIFGRGAGGR